jgi:hypothetical protein
VKRGFSRSYNQAAQVPSSKVTLVHIHTDILHAIYRQGAPFWRGLSRTLKTLLQKGAPFYNV